MRIRTSSCITLTLIGLVSGIVLGNPVSMRLLPTDGGPFVSVASFGAVPDDNVPDDTAIRDAIASLPPRGGSVWFPAGTYTITQTIQVGNGNGGTTPSSTTGIKLIGEGGAFGQVMTASRVPTKLEWQGPAAGTVMSVNGRISDCVIRGFLIDCNNIANAGLAMTAFSGCLVENIKIVQFNDIGLAIFGGSASGTPGVINYNIHNQFSRIHVATATADTTCLYMDGDYGAVADTWMTAFDLCRFEGIDGTPDVVGAWLKFVDSITFRRCHFDAPDPSIGNVGVIFDALGNHDYPVGIAFHDCSVQSTVVCEDEDHRIRKNYFYGYGTYDNEQIPTHGSLLGITDKGVRFGNWGPSDY